MLFFIEWIPITFSNNNSLLFDGETWSVSVLNTSNLANEYANSGFNL